MTLYGIEETTTEDKVQSRIKFLVKGYSNNPLTDLLLNDNVYGCIFTPPQIKAPSFTYVQFHYGRMGVKRVAEVYRFHRFRSWHEAMHLEKSHTAKIASDAAENNATRLLIHMIEDARVEKEGLLMWEGLITDNEKMKDKLFTTLSGPPSYFSLEEQAFHAFTQKILFKKVKDWSRLDPLVKEKVTEGERILNNALISLSKEVTKEAYLNYAKQLVTLFKISIPSPVPDPIYVISGTHRMPSVASPANRGSPLIQHREQGLFSPPSYLKEYFIPKEVHVPPYLGYLPSVEKEVNQIINAFNILRNKIEIKRRKRGLVLDVSGYLYRSKKPFYTFERNKIKKNVLILLDISGSITGLRESYLQSLSILAEALNRLNVEFEIDAFNGKAKPVGDSDVHNVISALGTPYLYPIKKFEEKWNNLNRRRLYALDISGSNADGRILEYLFTKYKSKDIFALIFIGDGEPSEEVSALGDSFVKHRVKLWNKITSTFAYGVGTEYRASRLKYWGFEEATHLPSSDPKRFPEKIVQLLSRKLS